MELTLLVSECQRGALFRVLCEVYELAALSSGSAGGAIGNHICGESFSSRPAWVCTGRDLQRERVELEVRRRRTHA